MSNPNCLWCCNETRRNGTMFSCQTEGCVAETVAMTEEMLGSPPAPLVVYVTGVACPPTINFTKAEAEAGGEISICCEVGP